MNSQRDGTNHYAPKFPLESHTIASLCVSVAQHRAQETCTSSDELFLASATVKSNANVAMVRRLINRDWARPHRHCRVGFRAGVCVMEEHSWLMRDFFRLGIRVVADEETPSLQVYPRAVTTLRDIAAVEIADPVARMRGAPDGPTALPPLSFRRGVDRYALAISESGRHGECDSPRSPE